MYGNLVSNEASEIATQHTGSTQASTASSLTQINDPVDPKAIEGAVHRAVEVMKSKQQKHTQDMESNILQEMTNLNREANERISRIETSLINYEKMILELHNNNKAKADEMAKYEQRLTQIGTCTSNTANKVDKLSMAMKSFINVMADVIGPNQTLNHETSERQDHLRQLVSFLEDDEAMDTDGPF